MQDVPFDPTTIPSMGTHDVGPALRDLAAKVSPEQAIVEVGTWLGGGTAWLALGASAQPDAPTIHTFDQFQARPEEVYKALRGAVEMQVGTDTLPIVQNLLAPTKADIVFHKGDLLQARWTGGPIGLYVDDAAKTPTLFYHALSTFAPHWVSGETIIVLMDYRFWERVKSARGKKRFRVQQKIIEQHPDCFEEILQDTFAPAGMGAFRYTAPLPMQSIRRQAKLRRMLDKLPG